MVLDSGSEKGEIRESLESILSCIQSDQDISNEMLKMLCPVTWKTLRLAFNYGILGQ